MKTEDEILAEVMKQSEIEYKEHQEKLERDKSSEGQSEAKFDEAMEKALSESNKHFERYIACSLMSFCFFSLQNLRFFYNIYIIIR